MSSPAQVLQDPNFQGLPVEERRKVLLKVDPNFGGLPKPEQDKVLGPRTDTPPSILGEIGRQVKQFGQGAIEGGMTVMNATHGDFESAKAIGKGLYESVAAPGRELIGQAQPGMPPSSAPQSIAERATGAFSAALGGDPARERMLKDQGAQGAGVAAGWTQPMLNAILSAGLGGLLKRVPTLRKRTAYLTAASGGGPKVPASFEQVMPQIDRTIAEGVPARMGGKEPVWQKGKSPNSLRDLSDLTSATMDRTNREFNSALGPFANQSELPKKVSDAIRSEITPNMDKTAEGRAMKQVLENRAVEFERDWTLGELNEERMRLFRSSKAPMAERIAQRTNADVIADTAAEKALRDVVYDRLGGLTGKGDYFQKLKRDQAALFNVSDRLAKEVEDVASKQAIREGTPLYEREHVSVYGHPETGRLGTSAHGLQKMLPGSAPEPAAARKVKRAFKESPPGVVKRVGPSVVLGRTKAPGADTEAPPMSPEQWAQ